MRGKADPRAAGDVLFRVSRPGTKAPKPGAWLHRQGDPEAGHTEKAELLTLSRIIYKRWTGESYLSTVYAEQSKYIRARPVRRSHR